MTNQEKKYDIITDRKGIPISTKLQVEFNFVSRRLRILTIAIILGIIIIYIIGIFSPEHLNSDNPKSSLHNLFPIKIISLVLCIITCVLSFPLKNYLLKKVKEKNFLATYFNAVILPMALCDFGGLFCIVTNSFLLKDIIFSS
ncbi:MAG: hypothetical protein N2490_00005, partial [Ignavibacteria bacterium]|nr:hypothetical protein [Ignavibacteria bacterium]